MVLRVKSLSLVAAAILLTACGFESPVSSGEVAAEVTGSGFAREASALPSWHPPIDVAPRGLPDGHPPLPMDHPVCPAAGGGDAQLPWVEDDASTGEAAELIST
jgi:hypothetical protein